MINRLKFNMFYWVMEAHHTSNMGSGLESQAGCSKKIFLN